MIKRKKIFVAEDDVFISEQLSSILEELGYEVLDIGFDVNSSKGILNRSKPDIAILDIRMHGRNAGFEIAEFIQENLKIPFLFLTSHSDANTLKIATKLNPAAYLVKPFRKEQIFSTLEVVFHSIPKLGRRISINLGREKRYLSTDEILWVKTDDKYIEIQTASKKHVVRSSLSKFIELHKLTNIERVHRSFAVNIDKVDAVVGTNIIINEIEIPISRMYLSRIKDLF